MPIHLLSTKLYIPRRQTVSQQTTLVPRPHLINLLEAGLAGKLMLIAAPAGFGKSTLLSEWIGSILALSTDLASTERPPAPVAAWPTFCWLSLEENDNDPSRFWLYFIAALQSQNPDLSPTTPILLQLPEPPPLETMLTILLNDLGVWPPADDPVYGPTNGPAHTPENRPAIVLVLEDYHLIDNPEIHRSLAFLLDHLPPTMHLIMTTRADPPLPLGRLRANGQLSEIRADDLRFTAAETALFVNERMGLHLQPDEVQLLAERTEGWIAGLHLAALSMHGHADKARFLHSFSGDHRYILNYLTEEVLNQQPHAVQDFLLRTSILTRLCGPLCDAVMGFDAATSHPLVATFNSQAMLEQIDQANLFLVPLDDSSQWYRYHQLFGEVLQHRLRQSHPELVPLLYDRANLWYAQQGYDVDADKLSLSFGSSRPTQVVEQVAGDWEPGRQDLGQPAKRSASQKTHPITNQAFMESLTDREIDVLRLVTDGLSNAAIAKQLVVSVGTVKTHLKHIYGKLAVASRTQAVAQARLHGLL